MEQLSEFESTLFTEHQLSVYDEEKFQEELYDFLEDQKSKTEPKLKFGDFMFLHALKNAHTLTYKETVIGENDLKLDSSITSAYNDQTSDFSEKGKERADDFCRMVPGYMALTPGVQETILPCASWAVMMFRFCTRYYKNNGSFVLPSLVQITSEGLEVTFGTAASNIITLSASIKENLEPEHYAIMEYLCVLEAAKRMWSDESDVYRQFSKKRLSAIMINVQQQQHGQQLWNFMINCCEMLYNLFEQFEDD